MAETEGGFEPPVKGTSNRLKEKAIKTWGSIRYRLPFGRRLVDESRANTDDEQLGGSLIPQIEKISEELNGGEILAQERVNEIIAQIKSFEGSLSLLTTNSERTRPVLQLIRALQRFSNSTSSEAIRDARILSNSWISKNIDELNDTLDKSKDSGSIQISLDLVNSALIYNNSTNETNFEEKEVQFLIDRLENGLLSDDSNRESDPNYTKYKEIVGTILDSGSIEQNRKTGELLLQLTDHPELRQKVLNIIAGIPISTWRTSTEKQMYISEEIIKPTLNKFGLSFDKLNKSWLLGNERSKVRVVSTNMEEIFNLESTNPGICKVLVEDFGIENFARYPRQLLVDLYEQRENKDIPYGICFYPKADADGAFYDAKGPMAKFYSELTGLGYGMRLFEVEGKYQIGRAFVGSKRKYGVENKVEFVILAGHGTPDTIAFGEEPNSEIESEEGFKATNVNSILHKMDLEGRGVQRMGEFLAPNANIILVSCSTGRREASIGGQMSKMYEGTTVTAPKLDTTLRGIEVTKDDQSGLKFKVEYGLGVQSQTFSRGKNILQA